MTPNFVGHVDHVHCTFHEEKQRNLFHLESDNRILTNFNHHSIYLNIIPSQGIILSLCIFNVLTVKERPLPQNAFPCTRMLL